MKRLTIASMIALIMLVASGPTRLWADDTHHPEKAAKAKKATKVKPKQQKKPTGVKATKASNTQLGAERQTL